MGNNTSRPGPARRRSAPTSAHDDAYPGFSALEAPLSAPARDDDVASVRSYTPSVRSFAPSMFSERTLTDNASLYSATGTLAEPALPPSDAIRAGMAGAMEVLSGEGGWGADVANAQLEWLAQDAGRRTRWLRAEVVMQQRQAKRARKNRSFAPASKREKAGEFNLSLAGEDRAREEDAAVVRRLGMEKMGGEHRAAAEALAADILAGVLAAHPLPPPVTGEETGGEERKALEAEIRQIHKDAREEYHATCKAAADAHALALENARIAHGKAYSAAKVRYMGATLRAPQMPTSGTSMREASVGPIFE